ncbi:hypothetical protein J0X19_09675 [Hymenobacter sp. BT186]|uniref:Uncharacterized protein n=1 Tax=Hymenobacter telluris TaxID=2816474 RepID=A0A939JDC8_9BACT|nr:hypothetical protein [Hymenobacter telluris]MBO0358212.1 hypothetical protein [Hymenobacter telluris]MBW3374238.1 hypothetical protein [Hymenobacter norwichensis]
MRTWVSFWHRLLCLLLILLAATETYAQKPRSGYVVTLAGDTLRGAIFLRDEFAQQRHVEFVPLQGTEIVFLDAYQLASYTYYEDEDIIRYVGLPFYQNGSTVPTRGFLQQLVDGKVQLYKYRYIKLAPRRASELRIDASLGNKYPLFGPLSRREAEFSSYNAPHCLVVFQAGRPRLEEVNWWDLRKDAANYFADYPELAADLRAGNYHIRDIERIIRRYNTWHETRQQAR